MYNIKLTNVPFDNHYNNSPYFPSVGSRDEYFNNLTFYEYPNKVNFNKNNLLYTSIVINKLDNINDYNYCVVYDTTEKYYYFINSCEYISVSQYRLNLELDVISSYFVDITKNSFSNCKILKGMVNRFNKNDNGTYTFDINQNSLILQDEPNQPTATRLTQKSELVMKYDYTLSQSFFEVNEWLENNVLCWCYVYLDHKQNYTFYYTGEGVPTQVTEKVKLHKFKVGDNLIDNEYSVICVPIYKNANSTIRVIYPNQSASDSSKHLILSMDGISYFRENNNNLSYIYNIKFSKKPPFQLFAFDNWTVETVEGRQYLTRIIDNVTDNRLKLYDCAVIGTGRAEYHPSTSTSWGSYYTMPSVFCDIADTLGTQTFNTFENYTSVDKYTFTRNEIVGVSPEQALEPKMMKCKSYIFNDGMGGNVEISPLLWFSNQYRVNYREPLNITTSNYYFYIVPQGLYASSLADTEWGVTGTADNSLQVANDHYSEFLMNNKIYNLSNAVQMVSSLYNMQFFELGKNFVNYKINKWNLESKSNNMQSQNDNIMLNLQKFKGINLFVNVNESFQYEKDEFFRNIFYTGYTIEKYDNIYNYINTRKFFNYIKADVENINISMPHNVEEKLKGILYNGIRLWNTYDSEYFLNYNYENYEKHISDNGGEQE